MSGIATLDGMIYYINKYTGSEGTPKGFDDSNQKKMNRIYEDKVNLSPIDTTGFDAYIKAKAPDSTEQISTTFSDKEVQNVLSNGNVREALNHILTQPTKKLEELRQETEALNQLIAQESHQFRPQALINSFKKITDEGINAIKAQQKKEKEDLEEYMKTSDFQESLTKEDNYNAIKRSIIAALDRTHAAQQKAFNDTAAANLSVLHKAAQDDLARVVFLGTLSANYPKNRAAFLASAAANQQRNISEPLTGLSDSGADLVEETDPNVTYLKMTDITEIYTNSGNVIQRVSDGFRLEIGITLNPFSCYFGGLNVKQDLGLLARSIKASGFEGINMNIDFSTAKISEIRAQQAYRACIEAGFPPEKIQIKVNNTVKKAEELFAKEPNTLSMLYRKSQEIAAQTHKLNLNQASSNEELQSVKSRIQQIKSDLAGKRVATENQNNDQIIEHDTSNASTPNT